MKPFLSILLTVLFFSCNDQDANTYRFDGNATGFSEGTTLTVFKIENNQPVPLDTIAITNGTFSATFPKEEDAGLRYFQVSGTQNPILFFPENENMKVQLYNDSLQSSYVSGGAQNAAYRSFSEKLRAITKEKESQLTRYNQARNEQDDILMNEIRTNNAKLISEEKQIKRDFIKSNGQSTFSAMLLSEMLQRKEVTAVEASDLLEGFSPKLKANPIVTAVKQTIEGMKGSEVGGVAPSFSAPTPEGNMLSLSDAMGEYTLIDFWASWCKPCRRENPNVVKVYEKYHDKGLNIISVSLDKDTMKDRWIKAIADDKMDWYHVSNLQFWQDPIAKQYGVRSIPATFLIDKNGRIVAKNLRGPALEAKIASLLGS